MTNSLDKYHFNAARQETGERSQKTSPVLDKICSEVKVRFYSVLVVTLVAARFIFPEIQQVGCGVDLLPLDRRGIIGCQSTHHSPDKSVNYPPPPPLTE